MKVQHLIEIEAPLELVWAVTVDIERWPEWTPTVHRAKRLDDGPLDLGSTARLKQPGLPEADWTVTELSRNLRFRWKSRVRGISMTATHELTARGKATLNRLSVEVTGLAGVLLWPLIGRSAKQSLERENAGLKTFCEEKALALRRCGDE